jgi:putative hemolysin
MALLLVGSAFFSASETALFSIPRYQLRRLQQRPGLVGRSITTLLESQRSLLVTILLGNMFINVLYASLAVLYGARLARTQGYFNLVLVNTLSLAALIIIGEVIPKSVAVNSPLVVARLFAPVLLLFRTAIMPIRVFFEAVVKRLTALVPPGRAETPASAEDLSNLLEVGSEYGLLTPRENEMLREVIEFGTIEAREVMTPRIDVSLCDLDAGKEGLVKLIRECKLSKIPVWRDNPDNIVGVIHAKDVFLYPDWQVDSFVRKVMFFPETAKIDFILRELLAGQQTMAMVVDEYGGLEGIVSLEDILEEVVGEIEDEFNKAEHKVTRLSGDRYLVSAVLTLREWNDIAGTSLVDKEIETISGMVAMRLDRLPEKGDTVKLEGYRFTVLRVVEQHPKLMMAEKLHGHPEKGGSDRQC